MARAAPPRVHPASAAPAPRPRGAGARAGPVQKKLSGTAGALRRWHPAEIVEVWAEDEARLGLKPILRRVWAPRAERPQAATFPRYEWLWVYAAAHPPSGKVFWLVLPHLSAEMMQLFLDEFALAHATPGKRIVLVVDGAAAHRAKSLRVPERITLVSLPPYTPELNPAERLWPLVKEGVANRTHETLAALEEKVCGRCQSITASQITALTNYHWWPAA